ncbi:MAG: discoidin domain-containing protein, partial [Vicinamibacterales bacterium]
LVAVALARWATTGPRRNTVLGLVAVGVLADGWIRLPVAPTPEPGVVEWGRAEAVVELPPGDPATDFGALYRATIHGRPIVNGYSGYMPPHYLPLAHAIRDRRFSVLDELVTGGPIGIAVDTHRDDAAEMTQGLLDAGMTATGLPGRWSTFMTAGRPTPLTPLGPALHAASTTAVPHPENVGLLLDGRIDTGWGSGNNQIGNEEVQIDLGESRGVGALELDMGAFSFGHPRLLEVETSDDGESWTSAWSGETSVLTVRAAIQAPQVVPVTIELGRVRARYIRLRQVGYEPGIPWWIAELRVHAPRE